MMCSVCGKVEIPAQAKYCQNCKPTRRDYNHEYQIRKERIARELMIESPQPKRKSKPKSFAQVMKEAKATGMDYGLYVAMTEGATR